MGGNVQLGRAFMRNQVAGNAHVQHELARKARNGLAAFRAAAPKRTGAFAASVRIEDTRSASGLPGKRITLYPGPGSPVGPNDPNAPRPIEFGGRGHRGANAMSAARAAVRR